MTTKATTPRCPLCGSEAEKRLIERYHDPGTDRQYEIYGCICGIGFATPFEHPGVDWYRKFSPGADASGMNVWRFRQALEAPLPRGSRVLDVGCGPGRFLKAAQERGWDGVGLDLDPQMLDQARELGMRELHECDLEAFRARTAEASFDLIAFFDVLEHLPEPGKALALASDLLKPGGFVAVTLPNYLRPVPFGRDAFDYPPHHLTWWTPDALRRFVERHGFTSARLDHHHYMAWEYSRRFTYPLVSKGVEAAKRLLFGVSGPETPVFTDLAWQAPAADRGLKGPLVALLKDESVRQRLVNAAVFGLHYLSLPVFALLAMYYRVRRPEGGLTIRLLARKPL